MIPELVAYFLAGMALWSGMAAAEALRDRWWRHRHREQLARRREQLARWERGEA